jgi:hypothetical protein
VPEVVTRASSTGSRLYGVSLGAQPSHHAAERLLLQTALAELGTFDEALSRVVQRSGGYEARFAGMTEDQARAGLRKAGRAQHGPARPSALTRGQVAFSEGKRARNPQISHTPFFAPLLLGLVLVIVAEDTVGVALGVVELPALEQPEERAQPQRPRNRLTGIRIPRTSMRAHFNRNALSETVMEDIDIAKAAISGVARPAMASGTARTL